jgi:hypothetical protein
VEDARQARSRGRLAHQRALLLGGAVESAVNWLLSDRHHGVRAEIRRPLGQVLARFSATAGRPTGRPILIILGFADERFAPRRELFNTRQERRCLGNCLGLFRLRQGFGFVAGQRITMSFVLTRDVRNVRRSTSAVSISLRSGWLKILLVIIVANAPSGSGATLVSWSSAAINADLKRFAGQDSGSWIGRFYFFSATPSGADPAETVRASWFGTHFNSFVAVTERNLTLCSSE